jgi:molecular chaperone DnaK
VRMVRSEFESMVRDSLEDTVDALRRAVRSAGINEHEVDSVLLVGGSSRIPLVAQLVSAEFGRPIAVDADPKASIALGAARMAAARIPAPVAAASPAANGHAVLAVEEGEPTQPNPIVDLRSGLVDSTSVPLRPRIRRLPAVAILALIAIVVTAGAAFATRLSLESDVRDVPLPQSSPGQPRQGDGNTGRAGPVVPPAAPDGKMSTSGAAGTGGRPSRPDAPALAAAASGSTARAPGLAGGRGDAPAQDVTVDGAAAAVDAAPAGGPVPNPDPTAPPAPAPPPTESPAPTEPPVESPAPSPSPSSEPSPSPSPAASGSEQSTEPGGAPGTP